MKRPKYILLLLTLADRRRLDKLAKQQNTFTTRLAVAMVVEAITAMESGNLELKTKPRVAK